MQKNLPDPIVICAARRTPLGAFLGAFSSLSAPELGSTAISAALGDAKLSPEHVSEALIGCVLPGGVGQAPARQACRGAGLPDSVGATTVNRVCGSGMKSVMLAHDLLVAGSARIVVAGGMESMSNAPFMLSKMRYGHKAGHEQVLDHMMWDGLEDAYEPGKPMGLFGEAAASKYHLTRDAQDTFAIETLQRARAASQGEAFDAEIIPIEVPGRAGPITVDKDERPAMVSPEKIPKLKPAFAGNGTITAASSSANADGAAALVLCRRSTAEAESMPILATIAGHSTHSQDPSWYTTAPIPAIETLLARVGWAAGDVDLFEVNEAFAVVAMAAAKDIGIPRENLNVNGGACALGHPIGATGARIIVTLVHALRNRGLSKGIAALCIGGGEATAIAIEISHKS